MNAKIQSIFARFKALLDPTAIILILPLCLFIYWLDAPMFKTLIEWVIFAPIVVGIAVLISRIVFYQIKFTDFVERAWSGNVAAAIVVSSIIIFTAFLSYAIITWART